MQTIMNSGLICIKNKLNIEFCVCKIDYVLNEDETYKYVFTPYYEVIDLLGFQGFFQGIPGINLDLRKTEYIRENRVPVFISERVPQKNREDYYELLEAVNLDYMDPIEYLIRTDLQYCGDPLYVIRYQERRTFILDNCNNMCNSFGLIKYIIDSVARGDKVILPDGTVLNDINVFNTLMYLYDKTHGELISKQKKGIERAKQYGKYLGRKPKPVNEFEFFEALTRVNNKEITAKEAANNLGISIDKFYRLKKKYN